MHRKPYYKLVPLTLVYASLCVIFFVSYHPGWAAPLDQDTAQGTTPAADAGQEYIVQAGDSLYAISGQFYGEPDAYQIIIDATNAKAATDARFEPIADPRRIRVGQRLWIPDRADVAIVSPTVAPATATPLAATATPTAAATLVATATRNSPMAAVTTTVAVTQTATSVRFAQPQTGATVPTSVTVAMVATGLLVEPAGQIKDGAGHFHILIDTDFVPAGEVIITDKQHLHFGKGQYTTTLALEPGEHVLRLQFANGAHIALDGPAYQDTITVTVAEESASGPSVRFVAPVDGATVPPTLTVTMTATELTVEPAGEINLGAGHFHILIDTDFVPAGEVIITDKQHLHFGKGQYTTTLALEPGEHVLRLQFANGAHIALDGPAYQDTITVTVAEESASGPSVRFVAPVDGATVPPTVTVTMTATELTVEPAGEINLGAGHFHILLDTDFVPAGEVIITDAKHLHFGKGQYTTTLALKPGEHVLRLQFANGAHIALDGPAYQDTITVTVK